MTMAPSIAPNVPVSAPAPSAPAITGGDVDFTSGMPIARGDMYADDDYGADSLVSDTDGLMADSGALSDEAPAAEAPQDAQAQWETDANPYYKLAAEQKAEVDRLRQSTEQVQRYIEQGQTQAQQQAQRTALQQVQQQLTDLGADPQFTAQMIGALQIATQVASPQTEQRFNAFYYTAQQVAAEAHAWKLVAEHFGPQTTMAQAQQFHQQLLQYDNPKAMEQVAKVLAQWRRVENRRVVNQSGRERVVGGGQAGAGGTRDFATLMQRYNDGTATRQESALFEREYDRRTREGLL